VTNNELNQEQQAAYIGRMQKEDCNIIYPCFFDILDLAKYLYRASIYKQPFVNKKI
jgi:hypothetical protein